MVERNAVVSGGIDVLAVWQAAQGDDRLDSLDRRILATVARLGKVPDAHALMRTFEVDRATVKARLRRLMQLGYTA